MARKRMISPEIWESQDFAQLSDLAKIVFISLFSHADDEGRGRADPTFIKSSTFPYDKDRRVADIEIALSEIARSMSVQFYSVNGIEFYFIKSWGRWQKIDKPSKSKFPAPTSVGEGGDIPNCDKFGEPSANTPRTFGEPSATNRIESNIKEYPPTPQEGEARGEAKERFLNKYPKLKENKRYDDSGIDYDILLDRFERSKHLRNTFSMNWVLHNYDRIVNGVFDDTEPVNNQAEAVTVANERSEREHYYAVLRRRAQEHAEKAIALAQSDEGFKAAESTIRKGEIELARAEVFAPETAREIRAKIDAARKERLNALARLNLTEEDLQPAFKCKKCSDTGYLPDGRACDCYKKT